MDRKFMRKAQFVSGGHMADPPANITYSAVVSQESVRIAFLLAVLNDLEIKAADIGNAYLNAKWSERILIKAGIEFRFDKGCMMIVKCAWYGLKLSGTAWYAMLSQTMMDMGYQWCKADFDVWLRLQSKSNGKEYYEYVLIFVDGTLHISHKTSPTMKVLGKLYELNDESVGIPQKIFRWKH
eukprot:12143216-Ditylum_brightwellii.AAC.1